MSHPFRFLAHAVAGAALLLGAQVQADESMNLEVDDAPSAEAMALDLFISRPLSLVGTVLGTAVFIVALPFNALTLNFADPARRLIVEPAKYTFVRKLGDLE